MASAFPPDALTLPVRVTVVGPRRSHEFRCTLDTGASRTVLPTIFLRQLGCDLSRPVGQTRLRSATGIATVPLIRVAAITALERVHTEFVVAAHDLPPGIGADGLLGLDFFRGLVLTLDFIRGAITLKPPMRWWAFWR